MKKSIGLLCMVIIAVTLMSCHTKETKKQTMVKSNTDKSENLEDRLAKQRDIAAKKFSDEKKAIYADGVKTVAESGIYDRVLKEGDKAPNFTLTNQLNKNITLYDELKNGPVILTWYRGGWCPYCNITLHFLQESLPEFQKAGGNLIALTPELPDRSMTTTEKHELQFTILSDIDNKVAKEYGVVFKLTPEVAAIYQDKFDVHSYNGNDSDELPLAVTYVIDQNATIRYAFMDADYTKRAEPKVLIQELIKLQ